MRDGGAVVIDPTDVPQLADEDWGAQDLVLEYEFKHGITQYLESLGAGAAMGSLADLIAFNEANAERELALFGQEVFVSAAERGPLTDRAYVEALASIRRLTRQDGIDAVMSQHALAAIIAPTMGPAWLIDQVLGDRFDSGYSAGQAAIAGYPSITVPMGYVSGLPVGVSFFGGAWSEPVLIRLAYAYEQATRHRIAPSFQSSVA
jgi:amidase